MNPSLDHIEDDENWDMHDGSTDPIVEARPKIQSAPAPVASAPVQQTPASNEPPVPENLTELGKELQRLDNLPDTTNRTEIIARRARRNIVGALWNKLQQGLPTLAYDAEAHAALKAAQDRLPEKQKARLAALAKAFPAVRSLIKKQSPKPLPTLVVVARTVNQLKSVSAASSERLLSDSK